jgi:hypothetical protein
MTTVTVTVTITVTDTVMVTATLMDTVTATVRKRKLPLLYSRNINTKKTDISTMMAHARVNHMSITIIMMRLQKLRRSIKTSTSLLLSFMSWETF